MKKPKSEKLFGKMKPMPDMPVKARKKKKEPSMEQYHKERMKKMGM